MLVDKTLLSRYKIFKELSKGELGDTYLARDIALPGHPCCIVKHLSPILHHPQILKATKKLFDREAEFLYRLGEEDDRIPRLYAHLWEENEFFAVREFIDGEDLWQELESGERWSEEQTIEFLKEILEIFTVVHQKNIIHGNIRPDNIIRRRLDRKLVPIEFGTAKSLCSSKIEGGSDGYVPLEQSKGCPQLSSDVYAIGAIAISALTGIKPECLPKDPKTLEIVWRDRSEVGDRLADFLDKMVRRRFKARYQNAAEALLALQDTFSPTGVRISKPPAPVERKISKINLAIATPISLGLTIALIASFWLLSRPDYGPLKNYLALGKWKKADLETAKLMKQIAKGSLNSDAIENFDCKALKKLDQLWLRYSDGQFGFGPQKEIYLETGNEPEFYRKEAYQNFGDRVEWRKSGEWKDYDDLIFSKEAPQGHLPALGTTPDAKNVFQLKQWSVISRFANCNL